MSKSISVKKLVKKSVVAIHEELTRTEKGFFLPVVEAKPVVKETLKALKTYKGYGKTDRLQLSSGHYTFVKNWLDAMTEDHKLHLLELNKEFKNLSGKPKSDTVVVTQDEVIINGTNHETPVTIKESLPEDVVEYLEDLMKPKYQFVNAEKYPAVTVDEALWHESNKLVKKYNLEDGVVHVIYNKLFELYKGDSTASKEQLLDSALGMHSCSKVNYASFIIERRFIKRMGLV